MLLAFKNDIDKRWGGAIGQRAALSAERVV